jgi:hypothetical protein
MNHSLGPVIFCLLYAGSLAAIMILLASSVALAFWLLTKTIDLLLLLFVAVLDPKAISTGVTRPIQVHPPGHLKRAGQ